MFKAGYIEGIRAYAIWKNGEEVVGVSERPLKSAVAEILAGSNNYYEALRPTDLEQLAMLLASWDVTSTVTLVTGAASVSVGKTLFCFDKAGKFVGTE